MARVVVVSNRVPLPSSRGPEAGGLAVALKEALKDGGLWFGWSGAIAREDAPIEIKTQHAAKIDYATIDLPREDYRRFYVGFSNSTLWPLLHFQPGLLVFDRTNFDSYLEVNSKFAKALITLLKPDDLVWVHDYHLIPLAYSLRAGHPQQDRIFSPRALRSGQSFVGPAESRVVIADAVCL